MGRAGDGSQEKKPLWWESDHNEQQSRKYRMQTTYLFGSSISWTRHHRSTLRVPWFQKYHNTRQMLKSSWWIDASHLPVIFGLDDTFIGIQYRHVRNAHTNKNVERPILALFSNIRRYRRSVGSLQPCIVQIALEFRQCETTTQKTKTQNPLH